jgi:hypothetical protein
VNLHLVRDGYCRLMKDNSRPFVEEGYLSLNPGTVQDPDDLDGSVQNHKRKYKLGKSYGRMKFTTDEDEPEGAESMDFLRTISKRSVRPISYLGRRKYEIGKQRHRRLYQSHAEPDKVPLLKFFRVQIRDNCQPHSYPAGSTNNHCIFPSSGHFVRFSCMVRTEISMMLTFFHGFGYHLSH